jgi:hypothetical protein
LIVKNQKEILDSIRLIKEKLGIEDPIKDPENPADSTDQSGQDEENRKKKARSALASLKWKAAIQALNNQKSDE